MKLPVQRSQIVTAVSSIPVFLNVDLKSTSATTFAACVLMKMTPCDAIKQVIQSRVLKTRVKQRGNDTCVVAEKVMF